MKIFFTDTNSNLTEAEAREMGVVLIRMPYIYKGEIQYDGDGVQVDESEITTSALNTYEYQELFKPYEGNELVYVSQPHKYSSSFENLKRAGIPNLTVIDCGFIEAAQVKVLQRVMRGEPWDDIRQFGIIDNPNKSARLSTGGVVLFEARNGEPSPLRQYASVENALPELIRLTNSELTYGKNLNNTLRLHMGKNYVGGVYEKRKGGRLTWNS